MNILSGVTLESATVNNSHISNGTLTSTDIFQPPIMDFSNSSIITINVDTSISIDNELYTGKDLKDLFELKAILKQLHPELFLVQ